MTLNETAQPSSDEDPIVAEVRATREAIFAEFNYDLSAYFKFIREQEQELRRQGRVFLDPPPPPAAGRDAA